MGTLDIDYPKAVLVSLITVVLIAFVATGATSSAAFGAFNPSWDGASALREQADATDLETQIIRDTTEFTSVSANGSLGVVLSPEQSYTPSETARLNEFVRNGGTLLIAEDFGSNTNPLLSALGVKARINGTAVRDERYHYRSPAFPVANNVSSHSLVTDVSALTLNHGSVVKPNGATVLVNSSSYAYLDTNGNGNLDETETIQRYPVATIESVGHGRVIVVSDPSLFINVMLERSGNAAFVENLFADSDRVLIDASHTADIPPLIQILLTVRDSALLQLFVGLAGLTNIIIWARQPAFLTRLKDWLDSTSGRDQLELSANEIATAIAARHPEWDDDRIQRISRQFSESDSTPSAPEE